jgi:hypothetical protein
MRSVHFLSRVWGVKLTPRPGDGCQTLRFLRSLSQLYQGLAPSDASPIYNIHLEDPPHSPVVETPCHQNAYPLGDHSPSLDVEEANQPVRLDFRFADSQLRQLRDGIHSGSGGAPLSRQDCLVALLALCFSLADPCAPIERVHTMLNVSVCSDVEDNHDADDVLHRLVDTVLSLPTWPGTAWYGRRHHLKSSVVSHSWTSLRTTCGNPSLPAENGTT